MEQKENQRIILTKHMLKDSLLQLMETKSIQKISVCELCKNAGINRATFYNHYTMPSDILREIGNDMADEIQTLLKEKKPKSNTSLQDKVELVCSYLQKNKQTAKLLFQNNTPESEFAVKLIRGQEQWETVCSSLTSMYGEDGKDLMLTFLVHGAYCMITKWLLDDIKRTPKEMGKLISGICVNGLFIV